MNAIECLLHDEVTRLMDRLACSVPAGSDRTRTVSPTLTLRLDEMDTSLAEFRSALLADYGRWRRALDDLENLWALVAWRSAASEESAEKTTALAA
jgi:hypothetical protein